MDRLSYSDFLADWVALGGSHADVAVRPAFEAVHAAYTDSSRYFHDTRHILALLKKADQVSNLLSDRTAVRMAVWFHDIVCVPGDGGNEAASADLWVDLSADYMPAEAVECVAALILDTRHTAPPTSDDGAVLADIDIAGLGADARVFANHSAMVSAEFPAHRRGQCVSAHRAFLESLLERSWIYHTDHFRDALERQARHNINLFIGDQARAS